MNKKKFLLDTLLNIVATAIPLIILQLVTLPTIGRSLGENQYGLVITLISLFTILSFPFGNVLNNIRLLFDEKYKKNDYSGDFNILLLSSLLIGSIAIIVGSIYYEGKISIINILLIVIIVCFNLLREYLIVSFRIHLNYKAIMINNIILSAGYILGTYFFNITGNWHLIFIIGYGFSLVYIIKNTKLLSEPLKMTPYFKTTTTHSLILLASSVLKNILNYADKLLIFPLLGPAAVSIYYTASIIGKIMSMAINPVNGVILSYLAKMEKISMKTFFYILLATGCVGFVGYLITILVSPSILNWLYPNWANESLTYIYVTSATAIIGIMCSVIHPFILKFNNINWQLIINGSNVIVYIISTVTLYSLYDLMGFCIAILISGIYQLLFMIFIFIHSSRRSSDVIQD